MHVSYERVFWSGQERVTVENVVCRLYSGLEGCPWLEMFLMLTRVEAGSLALALETVRRLQRRRAVVGDRGVEHVDQHRLVPRRHHDDVRDRALPPVRFARAWRYSPEDY